MRNYLLTLVLKPESDRKAALEEIKEVLANVEGKIEAEEELASKKLAYEIKKTREGVFLLLKLSGSTELPARLAEVLRISDHPLRFMVTAEVEKKSTPAKKEKVSKKSGKEA